MTFSTNLFAKLNNCSLLRSFCQGFTSTMWFNMNAFSPMMMNSASLFSLGWMNCCSPMMNSTSLFSLGSMNYSPPQTPYTDTLPTLYTDSLANCYQGGMYNFNNSTSLFANNNVNYFNGCWGGALPQLNTWNTPQFTYNNSRRTSSPRTKGSGSVKIEERTSITVEGIDYSIMGQYASQVKLLRPEMQRKVELMFKHAKEKGWTLTLSSGYRSTAEQKKLYDRWIAGEYDVPVVAKPGTSRHEFGCAVDINVSGNGASAAEMGRYGRSIGLRWGGDWSSNREEWHFDLDPSTTPSR